ncbi:similar to Saccharomyces cerevisiae YLR422W Protein of unknown function with similarity to human DOCK proteins (guanine nucleotide exchange factors) [Maudiozyma barnettii]|uniref:DOCKER domain-containing protein n=1 Tax=Maudiozyma barnettii TaxID=61262 RepID=A0A8H2VIS6_9SACH|nr:Dck1p [Kazachstania barnettii]CAB4256191.1 similar to Saccharomyces cerevisiae YLR422W Protein of unknown function with similarity to human DOCK proteins (guanine nucleotide exchange factors) [Kazachstania barnettii]CAD1784799.1 similar to Saccharomyces cerevisiae YLR422W Protein of unknown function with similarity to human DOCK proteins (guanine nucleotide exchange factors) [Kazachstania barnettii]
MSANKNLKGYWKPTDQLLYGVIVKPFLPLVKHPELINHTNSYANLFAGSEVYIFEETIDQKWCRAYFCSKPLPEAFVATMTAFGEQLPGIKTTIVIFPKSFVHISNHTDNNIISIFTSLDQKDIDNMLSKKCKSPAFLDTININKETEVKALSYKKPPRPSFPYGRYNKRPLRDEIGAILFLLSSHIFSTYAAGEFEVYNKLIQLYQKLDDIRLILVFELNTEAEYLELIRSASCLLSKIAKYIFATGRLRNSNSLSSISSKDPCGFQGIFARDINTGELLSYDNTDLQTLVMSSVFYGLTNNFPISGSKRLNLEIRPPNLENFAHFHFLVDFKDIRSDPSVLHPNLENIVTSVYLRTKDEILTEPYIVNMTTNRDISLSLRQSSVVLFKDIPDSIIRKNKIYLVVVLTEKVFVQIREKNSANIARSPFIPFKSTTKGSIDSVIRGISAGIIDISPVFMDTEDILNLRPHKFKIHFYAPMNDKVALAANERDLCPGWGGVLPKILNNANDGIIINPRTLSMTVNIKNIGNDKTLEESFTPINIPVRTVKANFFNDMYNPQEVIYLNISSANLVDIQKKVTNIKSIAIKILSNNKDVKMNIYSNEDLKNEIELVSVSPGEMIGGRVRIHNIDVMSKSETLTVLAYLNGLLLAKGKISLKENDKIIEHKNGTTIDLMSSENKKLINLSINSEYPGNNYNVDKEIEEFTKVVQDYATENKFYEGDVLNILKKVNDIDTAVLLKSIDLLLFNYLEFIRLITNEGSTTNSDRFTDNVFEYFFLFLKKTLSSKDKNCRHKLFKMYYKYCTGVNSNLPVVGLQLLQCLTNAYATKREKDDEYAIALCEFSVFVLLLSVISSNNQRDEWKVEYATTFEEYCIYLSASFQHVIVGQQAMLQTYDVWLSILELHFEQKELFTMATMVIMSLQYDIDEWCCNVKKLNRDEHNFLNSKYLLLQRILLYEPFKNYLRNFEEDDPMILTFFEKSINTSLIPYVLFQNDPSQIDTIRLANSVMIIVIRNITNSNILKNLLRLIPSYCLYFIQIRRYCKDVGLFKPRRTFTELFPLKYPFTKYYVDSIVNDEIIVEILMEISTMICQLTKIAHQLYGSDLSFKKIVQECRDNINFESQFYLEKMNLHDIELVIRTIRAFFMDDYFPERKWLGITALLARSSLILLYMCQDTIEDFQITTNINDPNSITLKTWCDFFKSILMLANHKISNLPQLAPISRKAVYNISGRLRVKAAVILERSWNFLSRGNERNDLAEKYGINGISEMQLLLFKENPTLIREMYIFALHQDISATTVCCKIFCCITVNVWDQEHSFQKCLDYSIPELYNGFQAGRIYLHEYELTCFVQCLFLMIHVAVDDEMFDSLTAFLKEIIGFLHILMEAYKIPKQPEYDDDRIASQIEMFSYLLDANKPELFHRMLYEIYVHSIKKKDYVQAGLSLELLASTYTWDTNDVLKAISYPPLPSQSSFDRKEYLYKESAKFFTKGLKFEKALSVYKDLIKAYDEINYNLNGLAFAYHQISTVYTDLQSLDRLVPTYFKVSFMGFGFSSSLRNKTFIFEGLPFEHITSMQNRLLNVYHGSSIIQSVDEVSRLLIKPTLGRCINVTTVEPRFYISNDYTRSLNMANMNNKIRMYIENRDLNTFSSSRRLPGATNVADLWVEESTYTTASTFPTLMYRAEIIETKTEKLSPVQNAIRSLQVKIQELSGLLNMGHKILKENGDSLEIFEELSRNITGTISAPINGGSMQYKVFLKGPYSVNIDPLDISKLIAAYDELTIQLSACLTLHLDLLPSDELKYNHEMLVELFNKNFSEEILRNHDIIAASNQTLVKKPMSRRNSVKNPNKIMSISSWDMPPPSASSSSAAPQKENQTHVAELLVPDDKILTKYMGRRNSRSSSNINLNLMLTPSISNGSNASNSTSHG